MKTLHVQPIKKNLQQAVILFILLFVFANPFHAQENTENKSLSPYFLVRSNDSKTDQLPLKNTNAEVNIVGVIADVTIHQVYKNEGSNALEAIYTFPASTNAAVYAMEMKIGNRIIHAKIEEKQKARSDYEQAKTEGKRTSLLEESRPNVFQMNVANIMPGDEIEVTMKYTELLIPEEGTYSFVYPTVVGPRYTGENTETPSNQFTNTPYQKEGEAPSYNFNIHVNLSAGMPIQNISSLSHKITTTYPETGKANIALDASEKKAGNRDFILNYQLAGDKIESGLLLYQHGDENFFMMMVQPPKRIMKDEIPPREYIFIVDVSGSMNGFPIEVSKSLMRNLIVNLRPTDKFNLVIFAGTAGTMSPESVPATAGNVEKACSFMASQQSSGSTNLLFALKNALSLPKTDQILSRTIVVVTDGYVDIEKEAFDLIKKNNDQSNLFAFGIGSSVNRYLIEGMAHAGLGEPFIVTKEAEANIQAEKFRKYINNPVLTHVKKAFSNFDTYDVEPSFVPDVFSERPVIIYGKYRDDAKGSISIKGLAGTKNYTKIFNVSNVKPSAENAAIRYLWARKKIQMLDDYNKIQPTDTIIKEVTNLGLKYNLLTAYTSFIAIEEEIIANEGDLTTVKQPLPLPEDVSNSAVGFDMEIDGEDTPVDLYKEVTIESEMPEIYKLKILKDIETKLIDQATGCLTASDITISEINVTVDASGKVTIIDIKGNNISEAVKLCLTQCIQNWDFTAYKMTKTWNFQITF